ncbi:sensor histidine kinase [Frigoribacterium salinisoli]
MSDLVEGRPRRTRWWLVVDLALVVAALADAVDDPAATALQVGLGVLAAVALLARRRVPLVALAVTLPGLAVGTALLAAIVALATVGERVPSRRLLTAAGLVVLTVYAVGSAPPSAPRAVLVTVVYGLLYVGGPLALGLLLRTRTELHDRLRQLAAVREHDRRQAAEVALARERAVLAREMHDVVSHQVSLVAVRAGALQVSSSDPEARVAADEIRRLGVQTLVELRSMVAVLRASGGSTSGGSAAGLAPQPGLADLTGLLDGSGIAVERDVHLPDDLPAAVQRAVHRFVQEALTNARKHAPGASVHLRARVAEGTVRVEVVTGAGTGPGPDLPGSGLGLLGLRERAELLGGSVEAVLEQDGTHRLTMLLPVGARPSSG